MPNTVSTTSFHNVIRSESPRRLFWQINTKDTSSLMKAVTFSIREVLLEVRLGSAHIFLPDADLNPR